MEKSLAALSERTSVAEKLVDFLQKQCSETESRKRKLDSAWELVAERIGEVEGLRESLEKRARDLEERERELFVLEERKKCELAFQEEHLSWKMNKIQGQEERLRLDRESVAEREKKVELIVGALEARISAVEEKEEEFNLFREGKMRMKEEKLDKKLEECGEQVRLGHKKFREQEMLKHLLMERVELAESEVDGARVKIDERLKQIEFRGNAGWESLALSVEEEADLVRESAEEKLEKMMREFTSFQEEKIRDLASKEQLLDVMGKELELRNEQLIIREKFHEEIGLKMRELASKEQLVAEKEDHLIYKENELEGKERFLWDQQKELEDKQKEVDLGRKANEQLLEKLDAREKNLNSVREFTRNCFKEHLAIKRKLQTQKDMVEKSARDLDHAVKEFEFREKQMRGDDEESVDLKFIVTMDGKTLQMFLNDPEKDLESMGDEIFKVLHLSSDPAKLVLDAMPGFYPPRLRIDDVELNVRRTCITLLEQLLKMSPTIKPLVREEAMELATSWKSKMKAPAAAVEVLGFLLLLAAFDLASSFEKDEMSTFVMMLDQRIETAELHCVLGLEKSSAATL